MNDASVVLVGIAIVFACMVLITLILYAFPLIFGGKNKNEKDSKPVKKEESKVDPVVPVVEPVPVQKAEQDDKQLIAVITAAISAYMAEEGVTSNFRVVSFRRVGDNAGVWNRTARLENLAE